MVGRLKLLLDVGIISLLLTGSSWSRFQELELKIFVSLSFFFLPKVLIYVDRTVVWGLLGQAVCFYRKCLQVSVGAFQVVLVVKNPTANSGDSRDMGLIPRSGRSPGGGKGNPLQYTCLENPMNRGAWGATVHRVSKSWMQLKQLSMCTHRCQWAWCQAL